MNQKELTRLLMVISNLKKPFSLHGLNKNNSALIVRVKESISVIMSHDSDNNIFL